MRSSAGKLNQSEYAKVWGVSQTAIGKYQKRGCCFDRPDEEVARWLMENIKRKNSIVAIKINECLKRESVYDFDEEWEASPFMKKGTRLPDGRVFIKYDSTRKRKCASMKELDYLNWLRGKLSKAVKKKKVHLKRKAAFAKLKKKIKQGTVREDGKVFTGYALMSKNFETWSDREVYERRRESGRLRQNRNNISKAKDPSRLLRIRSLRESGMSKTEITKLLREEAKEKRKAQPGYVERQNAMAAECARRRYWEIKKDPIAYEKYKEKRAKKNRRWNKNREITPEIKVCRCIRTRISNAVKRRNAPKFYRKDDFLGCSPKKLVEHLESQFDSKMKWENHGDYWHIDHIRPMSSFDLSNRDEQLLCSHYTNLQPLKASENLSKSDKWDGQQEFIAKIV